MTRLRRALILAALVLVGSLVLFIATPRNAKWKHVWGLRLFNKVPEPPEGYTGNWLMWNSGGELTGVLEFAGGTLTASWHYDGDRVGLHTVFSGNRIQERLAWYTSAEVDSHLLKSRERWVEGVRYGTTYHSNGVKASECTIGSDWRAEQRWDERGALVSSLDTREAGN
jgi:hypothetical protein